jgi:hypothetical protein
MTHAAHPGIPSEPPPRRAPVTHSPPLYSRREAATALAALAALTAFQLCLAHYWLDLIDEGYFADLADRVARGELPYRDFSTVYTPGVHYLHAWTFGLLGRDLVSLRLLLVVAKAGLAVLLYVLTRRVAPPAFAVLPVALLFAVDTAPLMWEPHPAWYALLFALVCVWSICRLIQGGSDGWTALAGAAAGLSCAFKQNIGFFVLLAAVGLLLFETADLPAGRARLPLPRCLAGRWLWVAARAVFALVVLAALTWLLRAYLEPRIATVFLLPVIGWAAASLVGSVEGPERRDLEAMLGRLLWLIAAFLGTTLVWALPLLMAVGPSSLPLAQFVGSLDLTGFYWELAEPRFGFALFLLAAVACPIAVQRLCRPAAFRRRFIEGVAFLLVAALATDLALVDVALATPDLSQDEADFFHLSIRAAETVLLYLPSLAFWGGAAAYASSRAVLAPVTALTLRWYLLAGSLVLFNLYPRMDTMHVTYSGPILFVVGAFALYRLFLAIERRLPESPGKSLYRGLLFAALLVLPAAAALPNLEWRVKSVVSWQSGWPHFDVPDYVPMGVPGAGVLVPRNSRDAIGGVARYLRQRTAAGEPIFVYPTQPMFYYLADRPNPTRFGHVYPGAATPDEQLEMIATLETSQVHYVVWDQYWVNDWGDAGRYLLNKPLTDYLLRTFHTETMVGPFHILARSE